MLLQNAGAQASDKSGANRKITWQKPFGHSTRYFYQQPCTLVQKYFAKVALKDKKSVDHLPILWSWYAHDSRERTLTWKMRTKTRVINHTYMLQPSSKSSCKFCHFLDMHSRLLEYECELIARLINVQPAYPESTIFTISFSTLHHTIVQIQTRVTGANHKPKTPLSRYSICCTNNVCTNFNRKVLLRILIATSGGGRNNQWALYWSKSPYVGISLQWLYKLSSNSGGNFSEGKK